MRCLAYSLGETSVSLVVVVRWWWTFFFSEERTSWRWILVVWVVEEDSYRHGYCNDRTSYCRQICWITRKTRGVIVLPNPIAESRLDREKNTLYSEEGFYEGRQICFFHAKFLIPTALIENPSEVDSWSSIMKTAPSISVLGEGFVSRTSRISISLKL